MLPYVEQQALYDIVDFRTQTDQTVNGVRTATRVVAGFRCPSSGEEPQTPWGVAGDNYGASCGPTPESWTGNPSCACDAAQFYRPYADHAELTGYYNGNPAGPFTRNPASGDTLWACTMAKVKDGLTNTIFFGERLVLCSDHAHNGWGVIANNGEGMLSTLIPINYDTCRSLEQATAAGLDGCRARCNWNTEFGFRSEHPGGANFLMGDGSVHFLSQTIDMWTYQWLGAMNDKQPVQIP